MEEASCPICINLSKILKPLVTKPNSKSISDRGSQEEWASLEKRWHTFKTKAELEKSASELSGAVKQIGSELKQAYTRLRQAL